MKLRAIALGMGVILVFAAASPATAATQVKGPKPPTRAACQAFADYFQVEFLVAFASALAQTGHNKGSEKAAAQIGNTLHLVLSPKLEKVTRTLAEGTGPPLRKLFTRQAKTFGRGVALLEHVGLTKAQIQKLSELDLKPETDLQQVVGDVHLNKKELARAAEQFSSSAKSIDLNEATSKQRQAFQAAGSTCGVFPVGLDCSSVVTADEAAAVLGMPTTTKNRDGTCTYSGATGAGEGAPELAVDVYASSLAYDRLAASAQKQGVSGVGDAAVTVDGFNAFSSSKACGRTLIAKQGERTVVVAACTGATPPSAETLVGVANNVLARVPAN